VYGLVWHPMAWSALPAGLARALISSPLALLPLALAAVFLEDQTTSPEAWLVEQPRAETMRAVRPDPVSRSCGSGSS
jgi:hypothetical protein